MAALRRSLFSIIAAFAMFCGVSWTAAAYACREPMVSSMSSDSCDHAKPVNNVMPYCGPVCLGVVPAATAVDPFAPLHAPVYSTVIQSLHDYVYAPDPPPPRSA